MDDQAKISSIPLLKILMRHRSLFQQIVQNKIPCNKGGNDIVVEEVKFYCKVFDVGTL